MTISTTIDGDPASLRAMGEWLLSLPNDVDDVASTLMYVRSVAEAAWLGQGGQAFADHAIGLARALDRLDVDLHRLGKTFNELAEGLARAMQVMNGARETAATAHLLSGTNIIEVAEPVLSSESPEGPASDMTSILRTRDAFVAAAGDVELARLIEKRSHENFLRDVQTNMGSFDQTTNGSTWLGAGVAASYVNTTSAQYRLWVAASNKRATNLATLAKIAGEPHAATATSAAACVEAFGPAARRAEMLAAESGRLIGPLKSLPPKGATMTVIGGSVDDVTQMLTDGKARTIPLKMGGKLPFVGVVLTGAQTAYEIKEGKDPARAVLVNGGGLAAGAAGSGLVIGLAAGPPGWAVLGAGLVAAYGASYLIGETYDWAVDE